MGEKGNIADAAGAVGDAGHNIVTDTLSGGADTVSGIATGAVTGVVTGVAKDKVDDKVKKRDEPTG